MADTNVTASITISSEDWTRGRFTADFIVKYPKSTVESAVSTLNRVKTTLSVLSLKLEIKEVTTHGITLDGSELAVKQRLEDLTNLGRYLINYVEKPNVD